ncbi:31477_t:CDS:2, partial [Racocetra persica]
FFNSSDDVTRVINNFQNRFMVALSEVNKVPDGMKVESQSEENMKSKFIDIGPKSLLAIGTTYETQQILHGTKVLGEKNMDNFNNRKLCLVNIDHQNVALSYTNN